MLPATVGVVAVLAASLGHFTALRPWGPDAADPLEVVADLAPVGVACTQVVRVDEAGGERSAVCLTTGNEVLTISTFADRPDPDQWVVEQCRVDTDTVVANRGQLVVAGDTLVGVVAGPLSVEAGGPVPDPDAVASSVAASLGGTARPYAC